MDVLFPFPHIRRRRWLILAAAAVVVSGYGAYRIYHLPSVARRRRKLFRLLSALAAAADAAASSAEAVSLVSSDLNRFLRSDADDLPSSLKQLSKIVRSNEFSGSVSSISESLTIGLVRGLQSNGPMVDSSVSETGTGARFSDRVMDKLFSAAGTGFASVVVGSLAKGLVMGFYTRESTGGESDGIERSDSQVVPQWFQLVCSDESRSLIGNVVQLFVSTAVAVYLDKTMDINTYDELFSGLTNPKHEAKMKDMLVSMCNGAVETLVKTSHQVISSNSGSPEVRAEDLPRVEELDQKKDGGEWVDQITSKLAVPSNRRFILDVTGRITFETVRSFLDFVLWKIYDGAKRGVNSAREELVVKGLEVVRYISAKSMVIITICLSLCMHIFMGTRVLVPA
ncbi:Protein PHLOEM PROTEIN 2-LIKE [Musa troglodytarum]|uniref:Protein PHLOEM PROTEIN 2-LIKE n=1 Tax=Musa troglodytarum TaxID=320322 RepID=A0A9E7HTH5_9LILI|nr:Protein PHLOEM PROTEIN 2-LIKE [Musa troglodytarum]URE35314.1 Protein PHLOEM PROTEIN 2-LIKE [Musa troglodytarum]